MLLVACYDTCSTHRIFPALCNAGWVVVVCVCGGGGAICLSFWSLQDCLSVHLQLVFNVDSRKERKENSLY